MLWKERAKGTTERGERARFSYVVERESEVQQREGLVYGPRRNKDGLIKGPSLSCIKITF